MAFFLDCQAQSDVLAASGQVQMRFTAIFTEWLHFFEYQVSGNTKHRHEAVERVRLLSEKFQPMSF